jgi:hypothetical protein
MLVLGYWIVIGSPPFNLWMFGVVASLAVAICSIRFIVGNAKLFGLATVLLIAVDLMVVNRTLVGAQSPEKVFADGGAAAEWLATQPGRFRVYSPSYSIPQHVAELYGLELADGVDPLQLRAYADYLTRAAGLEPQGYGVTLPPFPEGSDVNSALKGTVPDAEMLGRLGVRYVAAAFPVSASDLLEEGVMDGVYVYLNRAAQPVVSAGAAVVLNDGAVLFEYDPWGVYVGWAASGVTVGALLVTWFRERRANG